MKSIKFKLLAMLVGVVVFLVGSSLLANTFVLPSYYYFRQLEAIKEAYSIIYTIVLNDPNPELIYSTAKKLESVNAGINVYIIADTNALSDLDPPLLVYGRGQSFGSGNKLNVTVAQNYSINPLIEKKTDKGSGMQYLRAMGSIHGDGYVDYYITVETTLEAISASVGISNQFQLYYGAIIVIISGILVLLFSNRFLRPILAVNKATKQMARLDFSQKIEVTSQDEVGELAQNINFLSRELESTISNLQKTNAQLQEELKHREQVDRMRQEFISNVSHELKTPIALIMGYAEGLKINVNEEDRDFYCDVIADEANKMNKMVRRLLYVAQLDSGAMQPEKTEFYIGDVVNRCLDKQSITLKEKDIQVEVDGEKNYLVEADLEQIEQVVTNYLTNALNHIDEKKKLRIRLSDHDGWVKVAVYNSGKAIPAESLPHLWESFYKVDKARTREYGGTGLGLYIVRTIIEAHQGGYGVRNIDEGVEFWFELPILPE